MTATMLMLDTYPRTINLDRTKLASTIDALLACGEACTACADACLSEDMVGLTRFDEFGLLDPFTHRRLGQVEVRTDLPDRAVTTLAQLDDLGLELGRERPPRP